MKALIGVVCAAMVGLLVLAAPVSAAGVDGAWSGMIDTPNGAVTVGFTFAADGATLKGTTSAPDGSQVAIKDGKIDGDKIAFNVSLDFGDMPVTIAYTGVVSGDQIKLTADFMGMPFEFTVSRKQ
ncbi:MAG TPA: hypothetical protein VG871_09850 [Vicinamibacterales bacterium]|nr:hypothetical protein [Vicinamibacterales bacterium]